MTPTSDPLYGVYRPWVERNGFAHWAMALIWLILAFVLFQVIASIVAVALIFARTGLELNMDDTMEMMMANLDLLFVGNTLGQVFFLGLLTWFVSRFHTSSFERPSFFRFRWRSNTLQITALTVVLVLVMQPAVWFLSWLNAMIPAPEFFESMQASQMEMIEMFLKGDHIIWLTLFHVALVPAVCEEVLFRGYVLRAFQKSWGAWTAIIVSGILFGMYHMQLTNLLPLAAIGILLAFLTWISGSIVPAMVAHFVNNGSSVLLGSYFPESALAEITPETMPPLWAVVLSLVISGYILHYLASKGVPEEERTAGTSDADPDTFGNKDQSGTTGEDRYV
ncbi:MAG: type II CAAX endopeptidase family protein [Balneolaceae bacterium]|nr:type II CAAX endopeptidase family protein [Balneolaceae bacterium]